MREKGVVTAVNGNFATVRVDKKSECDKCGLCLFPKGASAAEFTALNTPEAKEGDAVIVETSLKASLLSVLLVFLVPLILIGIAVAVGLLILNAEIWIPLISVILIVLWYTILAVIDKKFKNRTKFFAEIAEIINDDIRKNRDIGEKEENNE